MFRRKSKAPPQPELKSLHNVPSGVYEESVKGFADVYGSEKVNAARWFVMALATTALAIVAVSGYPFILPLKEVRPWIVETNSNGIVNKPVEVLKVDPNVQVVKSQLAQWVEAVYTIDPLRTSELMRWANGRVTDKATTQFAEFRLREKPFDRINREPNMVREAKVKAVDASQKGVAFVFVTVTERVGTASPTPQSTKNYRVTLNYKFVPSKTESELLANPLGLLVSYFSDAEERAL